MMASRWRALFFSVAVIEAWLTAGGTARADGSTDIETCASAAEESQSLRQEGKLTRARERLIVCARASCPAFVRKDCTGWLADVEHNLPTIVVRAVDASGKDVTDVRVLVDGELLTAKLDGRPLSVDPGEHSFRYESADAPPVTETVLIRQAETNRLVSVSFAPSATRPPPPSNERQRSIPTTSWILGGAGVVAGGIGAALWISGASEHSSLESGCGQTHSCSPSDVDSLKSKVLVGDIAMGVGLVAIGAAIVVALVSKEPSPTAHAMLTRIGTRGSIQW